MADSTAYIHITVNAGLQDIEDKVTEYVNEIYRFTALVNQTLATVVPSWKPIETPSAPTICFDDQRHKYLNLIETFISDSGKLKSRVVNLQGILLTQS